MTPFPLGNLLSRTMLLTWAATLSVAALAESQETSTKTGPSPEKQASAAEPKTERLQALVDRAQEGLVRIRSEIRDYECVLTKQERINGKLGEHQDLEVKIRHEKRVGDTVEAPFAVYARFIRPVKFKGREVIYVEGARGGDMLARRGGRRNPNMTVQLAPDGPLAMEGQRYPITQIGFVIMVERLIEVMETEFASGDCEIKVFENAKLDGRPCTHYEVTMRERNPESGFMQARMFVDNEYRIPVLYAARDWPKEEGGQPPLLELYAYRRVKLNVGLTDKDFDPANPDYNFAEVKPLPDKVDEN